MKYLLTFCFIVNEWNSTYEDQLVKISEKENYIEKLNRCFDTCRLQRLTLQEVQFLRGY